MWVFFSCNKFIWRCPIISWYCHLRWPGVNNPLLLTLTNIGYQKMTHISTYLWTIDFSRVLNKTLHQCEYSLYRYNMLTLLGQVSVVYSAMNFLTSLTNKNRWCPPPTPLNKNISFFFLSFFNKVESIMPLWWMSLVVPKVQTLQVKFTPPRRIIHMTG